MTTANSHPVRLLTVREIAKRIRREGEDLEAVINRLRNWTKEGLLQFVGEKHPGTGKSRTYPEIALVDALVLSTLTSTGIPAVRAGSAAGPYMSVLNYARLGYEKFEEAETAGHEIFLIIGAAGSIYDGANPHFVDLFYGRSGFANAQLVSTSDVIITVNLTKLFRLLKRREEED